LTVKLAQVLGYILMMFLCYDFLDVVFIVVV